MPISLTLKNVPDAVYERLKAVAAQHRRSLNNEAIVRLEAALAVDNTGPAERLARIRALRASLPQGAFSAEGIAAAKQSGRP